MSLLLNSILKMSATLILLFAVTRKQVFWLIRLRLALLSLCMAILLLSRIFLPLKLLLPMLPKPLMNCPHGCGNVFLIIPLNCSHFWRMNLIERRPLNLDSFRNQVISLLLSMLPQLFSQYLEAKDKAKKETTVQK